MPEGALNNMAEASEDFGSIMEDSEMIFERRQQEGLEELEEVCSKYLIFDTTNRF